MRPRIPRGFIPSRSNSVGTGLAKFLSLIGLGRTLFAAMVIYRVKTAALAVCDLGKLLVFLDASIETEGKGLGQGNNQKVFCSCKNKVL